jgi:hypothetical protein
LHRTRRNKGLLQWVAAIDRELLDRCHKPPLCLGQRDEARTQRFPVDIDNARTAIALPAAEFRPRQIGCIAQRPQ